MKSRKDLWSFSFGLLLVVVSAATALAEPIFGPKTYARTAGGPETFAERLQACSPQAVFKLAVENGIDGKNRVSSASISLNGVEVVRPSDLNQRTQRLEKEINLQGDNTLAVRLTSNAGGSLTVSIFCVSGCFDVEITSPTPGSTLNRARALVQGRLLNASGEAGVVLTAIGDGEAEQLAQVQGNLFAGLVTLQQGENTITAIATDTCGNQVREEVTVHTDVAKEEVRLRTWPGSGVLPASGAGFPVTLEAATTLSSLALHYAWDFDGDGSKEQSGSDLDKTVASYAAPGLYLPTVTVTDAQGEMFMDTAVVLILTQEEMDALLKEKWDSMREALVNDDIDAALRHFEGGQESKYRQGFEKLRGKFAGIFTENEELSFVSSYGDRVEYENLVIEGDKAFSYPIIFIRDVNGLWKIRQF